MTRRRVSGAGGEHDHDPRQCDQQLVAEAPRHGEGLVGPAGVRQHPNLPIEFAAAQSVVRAALKELVVHGELATEHHVVHRRGDDEAVVAGAVFDGRRAAAQPDGRALEVAAGNRAPGGQGTH